MAGTRRLVVGISGASGAMLGIRLLQVLQPLDVEVHLVVSRAAELTIAQETDLTPDAVRQLADRVHEPADVGASIASGSFATLGMVVVPCSIRTMSEIAAGVTSSLLTRAADVALKERRRLVLAVRETPLHALHLRHLADLAEAGAIIAPPVPAFYTRPKTVDDIVDHTVGRILRLFDIDAGLAPEWQGLG
ncbi:UbiX family flavin prenyltransferase [Blastochloris sulfoviridis]|uniref:Flavin prenyltransferase UbiX n=1 Tax=Blastochloris sulfoviridis TaxID=50712 RepID=A0A5M6HIQ4_9HYPH|nr:UbiX family flavin prenyltransferase [Blastochloris sulfoviridis]KAA5595727.1 UbiX family flavin prenyltransferase [Blastochloris sulfoviridis]